MAFLGSGYDYNSKCCSIITSVNHLRSGMSFILWILNSKESRNMFIISEKIKTRVFLVTSHCHIDPRYLKRLPPKSLNSEKSAYFPSPPKEKKMYHGRDTNQTHLNEPILGWRSRCPYREQATEQRTADHPGAAPPRRPPTLLFTGPFHSIS